MINITRGTTPTITINVVGSSFEDATPYVTIKQRNSTLKPKVCELTKSGDSLIVERGEDSCTLEVTYTQEETLAFNQGRAELQLRWIESDGTAGATVYEDVTIHPILKEGVIEHE